MKDVGTKKKKDRKASSCGAQGSDSGHPERSKREGNAGIGPPPNGLPRTDGATMVSQVQQDCSRAIRKSGQLVGRNGAPGSEQVDSGSMAQSLHFSNPRQRNGGADREFVDDKFRNLSNPKDGYAVVDCKDMRAKQVLEFLFLLLYLEKPTRVL